jgi:hypothetical protein
VPRRAGYYPRSRADPPPSFASSGRPGCRAFKVHHRALDCFKASVTFQIASWTAEVGFSDSRTSLARGSRATAAHESERA